MKIAGFQKLSLVDYPGNISSVVFIQGCNFFCGYCQNPDLIGESSDFECSEKEFFEYFSKRAHMLDGIVISGGEPCTASDLPEFISRIKMKITQNLCKASIVESGDCKNVIEPGELFFYFFRFRTKILEEKK